MTKTLNWAHAAARSWPRRQRTETPAGRNSGVVARQQAADAEMVTRNLKYLCAHRGEVELLASLLAGKSSNSRIAGGEYDANDSE